MIISFINQKGGVGKTTLAFNFAYYLSKKGKTLFIDTDPQQSMYNFLFARDDKLPFKIQSGSTINKDNYTEYDYVIVDSAGFDSEENREIIRQSDKVIVPTILGILDIQSTYHIINIFKENKILGYNTEYYLLFNMVAGKDSLVKDMKNQIKEDIDDAPITILNHYIKHSVDFGKSLIQRKSIFEAEDTKRAPTAKQLRLVIQEVFAWNKEK